MARKKQVKPQQLYSGEWYVIAHGKPPHREECCHCALTHDVAFKVENGRVWFQYIENDAETDKARKRRGIDAATIAALHAAVG